MDRTRIGTRNDDTVPRSTRLARVWMPCLAVLGATGALPAFAAVADEGADNERWQAVRKNMFADRPISEDAQGILELETPVRAADASVVPIAIRTQLEQTPARYIKKLWLVIDRNPSPVGAIFTFTPESGRADLETRVRIEEYTYVRAIAELALQKRYVKASGGCSAPAGKDLAEAMASVGKMKLRVEGEPSAGKPLLAQLMISHPNVSGLAIDQVTRLAPVPYYVRTVNVSYGGKPVMSADVDFTLSENPSLRFYFVPQTTGAAELRAQVVDSNERQFESAVAVRSTL